MRGEKKVCSSCSRARKQMRLYHDRSAAAGPKLALSALRAFMNLMNIKKRNAQIRKQSFFIKSNKNKVLIRFYFSLHLRCSWEIRGFFSIIIFLQLRFRRIAVRHPRYSIPTRCTVSEWKKKAFHTAKV